MNVGIASSIKLIVFSHHNLNLYVICMYIVHISFHFIFQAIIGGHVTTEHLEWVVDHRKHLDLVLVNYSQNPLIITET